MNEFPIPISPMDGSSLSLLLPQERTKKRIAVIFGTRPEAIKLAPLILLLRRHPGFVCDVCVTAQHRQMLDQVLVAFGIDPDTDLNLMQPDQSLPALTARVIYALDQYVSVRHPDMILVQGDTTTAFSAALTAFYRNIPVGHVEAGLRTGNMQAPWPEETNRVLTSRLAHLHFAPTEKNRENLLREQIPPERIFVTGNTVIDALSLALEKVRLQPPWIHQLPAFLQPATVTCTGGKAVPPLVLITGHRRENFGAGFENICTAIAMLAQRFSDVHFVYPVHLNPNVQEPVRRILNGGGSNIHLLEPLDYLPFVGMMNRADAILTDSGGIQEEAPSLGKPVFVMRDTTERPEAVETGAVMLVGTTVEKITGSVSRFLGDRTAWHCSARSNPYGDGRAADRHLQVLEACLLGEQQWNHQLAAI